jgi:hypothetical protein
MLGWLVGRYYLKLAFGFPEVWRYLILVDIASLHRRSVCHGDLRGRKSDWWGCITNVGESVETSSVLLDVSFLIF